MVRWTSMPAVHHGRSRTPTYPVPSAAAEDEEEEEAGFDDGRGGKKKAVPTLKVPISLFDQVPVGTPVYVF